MRKSAKSFRKTLQEAGAFYTPQALAMKMRAQLPECVAEVYDPTCGDGALLRIFGDDVRKYGIEIDGAEAEKARSIPNSTIFAGDTLAQDYFQNMHFDTIIANPPFGIKLNRAPAGVHNHLDDMFTIYQTYPPNNSADWAFIAHILHKLSDKGTAVCLMGLGALYRGRAEAKIREDMVNRGVFKRIELIRDAQFEDTSISVAMLTMRKHGKDDKSILFVDGDVERRVDYSEIKENGFDLNVNRYVSAEKQEDKWKDFDPYAHEEMIRAKACELLDESITMSKTLCRIDPCLNPIDDFLDRLQAVINKHRASESSPDNQTRTEDCL